MSTRQMELKRRWPFGLKCVADPVSYFIVHLSVAVEGCGRAVEYGVLKMKSLFCGLLGLMLVGNAFGASPRTLTPSPLILRIRPPRYFC